MSDAPSLRESPTPRQAKALADSHGAVKDYFIVIHEPGRIPDLKKPPHPSREGAERMLAELLHYRPTARLTLARLTWNDDLWIDDGHETLSIAATFGSIRLPDGGEAKLRHYERGLEVWVRAKGTRYAHKAAGPFGRSLDAVGAICGPIWKQASESNRKDGSSPPKGDVK